MAPLAVIVVEYAACTVPAVNTVGFAPFGDSVIVGHDGVTV